MRTFPTTPPSRLDTITATTFARLLERAYLAGPADLAAIAVEEAALLGVDDLVLYLADHDETWLVPVPGPYTADRTDLSMEGSLGGRAFTSGAILQAEVGSPLQQRLWIPLLDGTARLGVAELVFAVGVGEISEDLLTASERYAHLLTQLLVGKAQYGDVLEFVRRRRPLSAAAELQRTVLPPWTFATGRLVLSAFLESSPHGGGDGFDYAVNGDTAHVAVLDAGAHGVAAAARVALALAVYRNARRAGAGLLDTWQELHAALRDGGYPQMTAVLAELDLETGRLAWCNAGHPPPLLLRRGRLVRALTTEPSSPLGAAGHAAARLTHEVIEPGDRVLLHTDGLLRGQLPEGPMTTEGVAGFLERAGAAHGAPETVRRLRRAMRPDGAEPADDASAVLLEWSRGEQRRRAALAAAALAPGARRPAGPAGPAAP